MFGPKLAATVKNYARIQFVRDLLAGLIVGIVALPLAIAFAIASGVSPEKGLYTAVIAGFIVSAFGGSKVQIGGPTGAFIVIISGVVQQHGIDGLIIATFIAGIILIIMGTVRLGSVIKFIPYPLVVGFTSGIAVVIFSAQMKDFFGLQMEAVPADFFEKWLAYGHSITTIDPYSLAIAAFTLFVVFIWPKVMHGIPGSLIAIILTSWAVHSFSLPVETIGSRFGSVPSTLPSPSLPHINFDTIKQLIQPAFTIALLSNVSIITKQFNGENPNGDAFPISQFSIPAGVEVFEITGPLFFGAAYKFKDASRIIEKAPHVLIIRMRNVPVIDATGIQTLKDVHKEWKHMGIKLILLEVEHEKVLEELKKSRLLFSIGKANVVPTFSKAVERSKKILAEKALTL
jgi:MFS superfamily sulfate permease-like transporter